jgi:hypothetical protein
MAPGTCVAMALVILNPPLVRNRIRLVLHICRSFTAVMTRQIANLRNRFSRLPPISSFDIKPGWHVGDIGFFSPYREDESASTASIIEYAGNETYFRDVHVFINRAREVAAIKGWELLRNNLSSCLRGEALVWYTSKLSDAERRLLGYGNDLDEWTEALIYQFRESPTEALQVVISERCTTQDAHRERGPQNYAQTIERAARAVEVPLYCPPAKGMDQQGVSAINNKGLKSKQAKRRSTTGDALPRSPPNRRFSERSPTDSDEDLGSTKTTGAGAQRDFHAKKEAERRERIRLTMEKINHILLELGITFKPSERSKGKASKEFVLRECFALLGECLGLLKTMGAEGQSFGSVAQGLMVEVQSLRADKQSLEKEISRLLSGRIPTPPLSNYPSPIRESRSQPGCGHGGYDR